MRCEEVMVRDVQSCGPDRSVRDVARLMREYDIGFVPIVDDAQRVIGVVTDRDLTLRVLGEDGGDPKIESVMSRHVVSCGAHDDLATAERLMMQHKKARVVCTDPQGRLVGVLSVTDLAEVEGGERLLHVVRELARRRTWFLLV